MIATNGGLGLHLLGWAAFILIIPSLPFALRLLYHTVREFTNGVDKRFTLALVLIYVLILLIVVINIITYIHLLLLDRRLNVVYNLENLLVALLILAICILFTQLRKNGG